MATDGPVGAGRTAASSAAAATAVSMVTAPPASPPLGEDAARRACRLARSLTAGLGPLKGKVPTAGLRGSGRQVRAGRRRGRWGWGQVGRSATATSPPLPLPRVHPHTRGKRRGDAAAVAAAPAAFGSLLFLSYLFLARSRRARQLLPGRPRKRVLEPSTQTGMRAFRQRDSLRLSFVFSESPSSGWTHTWPRMSEMLYRGTRRR